MNKIEHQKWLDLCARDPDRSLCSYCKHFEIRQVGTWEYPDEWDLVCDSPLGPKSELGTLALIEQTMNGEDCRYFANKLPYKEAEGE